MIPAEHPYRTTDIVIPRRSAWSWFRGLFRGLFRWKREPRFWTKPRIGGGLTLYVRATGVSMDIKLDAMDLRTAAEKVAHHKGAEDLPVRGEWGAIYVVPACLAQQVRDLLIRCADTL